MCVGEYGPRVLIIIFMSQFIGWLVWGLGPGRHGDDQAILWVRLESAFVSEVPALCTIATLSSLAEAFSPECLGPAESPWPFPSLIQPTLCVRVQAHW